MAYQWNADGTFQIGPSGPLVLGGVPSAVRGALVIKVDNVTTNGIYLEDSNASPKNPWAIGLSTGASFNGIGFYDYGAGAQRVRFIATAAGQQVEAYGGTYSGYGVITTNRTGFFDIDDSNNRWRWGINGNVRITLDASGVLQDTDGTRTLTIDPNFASGGRPVVGTATNHNLGLATNNAVRFDIDTSGNLKANTTNGAGIYQNDTTLLHTQKALTNGAGAAAGALGNAPAATDW